MTVTRWLWLVTLLFISACGTKKECDATSCPFGCCDTNGGCQMPSTSACGTQGAACSPCGFAQTCQLGVCTMSGGGGPGGGTATGGGTGTGGGSSTGGGTGADGGTASFRQYELTLSGSPLSGSCFHNGVPASLPASTMRVLLWTVGSRRFVAFQSPPRIQLGDAPEVVFPQAAEGSTSANAISFLFSEQVPVSDQYTDARQTQASLEFDSFDAPTNGSLTLNAQYACIRNRADCPTQPLETSCQAAQTFTLTAEGVSPLWFTVTQNFPSYDTYLVAWSMEPVQQVSVPTCFRNSMLPATGNRVSQNARELYVMQAMEPGPSLGSCSASSCPSGCCRNDGTCASGNESWACGGGGAVCRECSRPNDTCSVGVCSGGSHAANADTVWLGIEQLRMGDSPVIYPPYEIGREGDRFSWQEVERTQQAGYTEIRQTSISLTPPSQPDGEATFTSQFACVSGSSNCPVGSNSAQDAASCTVTVRFWPARAP